MLEISKKTNLLEQNIYKYTLQDVEEPNLYREMFDYESVPKIAFNPSKSSYQYAGRHMDN